MPPSWSTQSSKWFARDVPVVFVAGTSAGEFEAVIGNSHDIEEMTIAARRMLPPRIRVSSLEEVRLAA